MTESIPVYLSTLRLVAHQIIDIALLRHSKITKNLALAKNEWRKSHFSDIEWDKVDDQLTTNVEKSLIVSQQLVASARVINSRKDFDVDAKSILNSYIISPLEELVGRLVKMQQSNKVLPHQSPIVILRRGASRVKRKLDFYLCDDFDRIQFEQAAKNIIFRFLKSCLIKRQVHQRDTKMRLAIRTISNWLSRYILTLQVRLASSKRKRRRAILMIQRLARRFLQTKRSRRPIFPHERERIQEIAKNNLFIRGLIYFQSLIRGWITRRKNFCLRMLKSKQAFFGFTKVRWIGKPCPLIAWSNRRRRQFETWEVDQRLVRNRCVLDLETNALTKASEELGQHMDAAFAAWYTDMRKTVLTAPVNKDEWLELIPGSESQSAKSNWFNLKTGITQGKHPHLRHVDINEKNQRIEAARQLQEQRFVFDEKLRELTALYRLTESHLIEERLKALFKSE